MRVVFERREQLAPAIWQYYFRPERPVRFVPGQYVDLHLPDVTDDPRGRSRTFTLTSLPDEPLISFIVKIVGPMSRYKKALEELQPGDEAKIDDAMGDLVLPKSPDIPLVFAGGGIGVASFVSMVRSLDAPRDITMFYLLRQSTERILGEVFDPLQPKHLVRPERLTAEMLIEKQPDETLYYLSGSQRFVESLRADLRMLGVPHEQIVFDYYDGYIEL